MINLLFIFLFLTIPIFLIISYRVIHENIFTLSIVNITLISLYLFSVLGTFPLFYHLDSYRVFIGIVDQSIVLKVLFYSAINIVFFIGGIIIVRNIFSIKPLEFQSEKIKVMTLHQTFFVLISFFICLITLLLYLSKIDNIALLVAIRGDVEAVSKARSRMGNDFPGKYHRYRIIMNDLGNMISFAFYVNWLKKKSRLNLLAFILSFTFSCFVALMTTEKAPFIWFLIGLVFCYFLTRSNGKISFKKIAILLILTIIILVFLFGMFMEMESKKTLLNSVISRIFSGSIDPAYFYLEYFPFVENYLYGKTFPNPGHVLPFTPVKYTENIMNWKFPHLKEEGIIGTMPTVFWGEAYANFGPLGVPIVSLIMGLLVSLLSYYFSKLGNTPIGIGILVWYMLYIKDLSVTGFSRFLLSNMFFLGLFIILPFIYKLRLKLKDK